MTDPCITGCFSVGAAILGGLVSKYGIPYISYQFCKRTVYKGVAEDIDITDIFDDFHKPIFTYRFSNTMVTVRKSKITLESDIESIMLEVPNQTTVGKIAGSGLIVDGRAYIEYEGKYSSTNERWESQ